MQLTESKYFGMRRAIVSAENGDTSDGLIITQLPAAIAPGEYRKKLNILALNKQIYNQIPAIGCNVSKNG